MVDLVPRMKGRSLLFSNEGLFRGLLQNDALLAALADCAVPVQVIVFLRDPAAHALSSYGQRVKRDGETRTLDEFLKEWDVPHQVNTFLDRMSAAKVAVKLRNYSRLDGSSLLAAFEDMLDVPPGTLRAAPNAVVNRSLTPAEAYLQRRFNAVWGPGSARFLSDRLCDALPDQAVDRAGMTPQDYEAFVARLSPMVAQVNRRLPEGQALRFTPPDPVPQDQPLGFSPEQIDVLVSSLGDRIARPEPVRDYLDLLRRVRPGYVLTPDDLLVMARLAQSAAPQAKAVPRMIERWTQLKDRRGKRPR